MGPRPAQRHAAGRRWPASVGGGASSALRAPKTAPRRHSIDVRVLSTCRRCAALAARRQGVPPHRWCQTRATGAPRQTPHQRRSLPAPPGPRLPSSACQCGCRSCWTPSIASQGPHGGRLRQTTADEGRGVRLLHEHGACPPGSGAGGPPERPPRLPVHPLLSLRSLNSGRS